MILTKFVEKSRINTVNLSEKCSTSGEHSDVSDISDISDTFQQETHVEKQFIQFNSD